MIFIFNETLLKVVLSNHYKMNEIVNKYLLAGHKFMHEMHLKQPGFFYIACGKNKENK